MRSVTIWFIQLITVSVLLYGAPADPPLELPGPGSGGTRPQVALVLEGGGALGLAHIGVIKILEEAGIPVDMVVGTSMGSIVGGLYASGYNAENLQRIVEEIDWQDLFSENSSKKSDPFRVKNDRSKYFASIGIDRSGLKGIGGLLSGKKILTYMDCLVSDIPSPVDFDTLPRRFRAVAADISTGEEVVLRYGSISDAMRASMSIVGVFAPFRIEDRYLMDGGIIKNLPVDIARSMGADIIIAVDLPGGFVPSRDMDVMDRTPVEYLTRTMDIMVRTNVAKQLPGADHVITVDLGDYTLMDFSKSSEIVQKGETAARARMESLLQLRDNLGVDAGVHFTRASVPFTSLLVEGGDKKDNAAVKNLLGPLIEEHSSEAELRTRAMRLYSELSLNTLRLHRTGHDGSTLLVRIEPREREGTSLRIGIDYAGTYTDRVSSRIELTPGIQVLDWPMPGSEFTLDLEMLNTLKLESSLYQGIADVFFLSSDLYFRHDFDTLAYSTETASTVDYIFYQTTVHIGSSIGVTPIPGAQFSAGLARDWNQNSIGLNIPPELLARNVALVELDASIIGTDAPIFPMDGLSAGVKFIEGIPLFGADSEFRVLETKGEAYISMRSPVSFGLLWRAAIDWSGSMDGESTAPIVYKPDLADRRMFPALLTVDERIGTFAAGAGVEVKLQSNRLSGAMGLPWFFLVQAAMGSVQRDSILLEQAAPPFYWSTGIGTGFRLSDGFGFKLRVGLSGNSDTEVVPYLSIDAGAIGSWYGKGSFSR
jgi:NTE family protein